MQGENIMGTMKTILLAAALACLFAFAAPLSSPFTAWHRAADQPVLGPEGDSWEAAGVFNPAAIHKGNEIILLYRAQDRAGVSRIGYAGSRDGLRFTRRKQPVLSPEAPYEKNGGVEDPRVVEIGGTYYLTYTGYNKKDAQLCLASSPDLIHWNRKGVILPAYKGRWNTGWTKSGAILDRKVNGKYWMYFMADAKNAPGQTGVAYSDDLIHWTEPLDHPVLPHRAGKFDSRVVEPGPPPIITNDGILLVYNGADDNLVYRTGWALFDKTKPFRLISRADNALLAPTTAWEKTGQVPNVVFVEGMIASPRLLFYYGAADKYIGMAEAKYAE